MPVLDKVSPALLATVQRPSRSEDGQGGYAVEYLDDHDITVFIGAPTGKDVPVAYRKEGVLHFPCYTDAGVDLRMGDRLKVNDRVYEVKVDKLAVPGGPVDKCLLALYTPENGEPEGE